MVERTHSQHAPHDRAVQRHGQLDCAPGLMTAAASGAINANIAARTKRSEKAPNHQWTPDRTDGRFGD